MYKISVCDDNIEEMRSLMLWIREYEKTHPDCDFSVRDFSSAFDLLDYLDSGKRSHIYFLDIVMPLANGLELGKKIRETDDTAILIYVTSSKEYALDSFAVNPFSYLIKPLEQECFLPIFEKALNKARQELSTRLNIKTKDGIRSVPLHLIDYVEYDGHRLIAHLNDGSRAVSTQSKVSFKDSTAILLEDAYFIKTHSAFVVNMARVKMISNDKFFCMPGNQNIPISAALFSDVKKRYLSFLSEKITREGSAT